MDLFLKKIFNQKKKEKNERKKGGRVEGRKKGRMKNINITFKFKFLKTLLREEIIDIHAVRVFNLSLLSFFHFLIKDLFKAQLIFFQEI